MKTLIYIGLVAGSLLSLPRVQGQETPLAFGSTNGICNEFGQLLQGRNPSCIYWGLTYVTGSLVQIIHAVDGVLYPPNPDGTPSNPNNVVIQTVRIGEGVDGSMEVSGMFSGSLGYFRRSAMTESPIIFARVFNREDLVSSSFYGDSQLYDVPVYGDEYGRFYAQIPCTGKPLSTNDLDGDGLNASWEKSYGSSDLLDDSDGDGFDDYLEHQLGSDPADGQSYLAVVNMRPSGAQDLEVFWPSSIGVTYQVQSTTSSLMNNQFSDLYDPMVATDTVSSTIITNGLTIPDLMIRVRAELP